MPSDTHNDKQQQFISMLEAAKSCAYSQEYLSLLARRGKLFARKMGRNWYTTRESLDEYLKKQSVVITLPKTFFAQRDAILSSSQLSDKLISESQQVPPVIPQTTAPVQPVHDDAKLLGALSELTET